MTNPTHQNHIEERVEEFGKNIGLYPTLRYELARIRMAGGIDFLEKYRQDLTTYGDQRAEEGFKLGMITQEEQMTGITPPNTTEEMPGFEGTLEQLDALIPHPKNPE